MAISVQNQILIERLKARMGSPAIKIHVTDDMIDSFIKEAVDTVSMYSIGTSEETELVMVGEDKKLVLSFNPNKVINVKPTLTNDNMVGLFGNYISTMSDSDFWWKLEGSDIVVNTSRNQVYVTYHKNKELTLDDLTKFYYNIAYRWALALTKEAEGKIRGKFTYSSSPVEIDSQSLISEAESEKSEILALLSTQPVGTPSIY